MVDQAQSVSVPQDAGQVAQALAKFTLDLVAALKAGGGTLVIASEAVTLAVADLAPVIGVLAGVGAEAAAEPIGVAEAFAIAGFQVARGLNGK